MMSHQVMPCDWRRLTSDFFVFISLKIRQILLVPVSSWAMNSPNWPNDGLKIALAPKLSWRRGGGSEGAVLLLIN